MYRSLDRVVVRHKEIEIHWRFEDIFKHFQVLYLPETAVASPPDRRSHPHRNVGIPQDWHLKEKMLVLA